MLKTLIKLVLLLIFFTEATAGESQFGSSGLGNLFVPYSSAGTARSFEMAHEDSLQLNFRNYSTWTNITNTTFSLNMSYNATWGDNQQTKTFFDDANFKGAFLAIPLLPKKLVFGVGIQPYTSLNVVSFVAGDSLSNKESENSFKKGGISRASFNLVYKASKNYSIGLGYEYTFGKITDEVLITIPDDFNTKINLTYENQIYGNGVVLSLLAKPLKDINIGITLRPTVMGQSIAQNNTLSATFDEKVSHDIVIPSELNFGIEYHNEDLILGMDMIYQDWKKFEFDGRKLNTYNTFFQFGIGVERKASKIGRAHV